MRCSRTACRRWKGNPPWGMPDSPPAHYDVVRAVGIGGIVGVNRFPSVIDRELALVKELAMQFGADDAVINDGFTRGGEGSVELGRAVLGATRNGSNFAPIYP